ncbi:41744_t:CDS:2, partial [Gigaspora margarita]
PNCEMDESFDKCSNSEDYKSLIASPNNYEINEINDLYYKKQDKNMMDEIDNSIREIFKRVFVNDSWICDFSIEKLYYFAKIYSDICYLCGSFKIELSISKSTQLVCRSCNNTNSPTKCHEKQFSSKVKRIYG